MAHLNIGSILALAAAAGASPGFANPAAAETANLVESVQSAKTLMLSGRSAEARVILEGLAVRDPRSNDVDFLLGLIAVQTADYDEAIRRFRTLLVRQPNAVRVRLELARAFYLKRDYDNAFRQFQFARAGRLSPGVAGTIDRFLTLIRRQKSWSYNFSLALAPDTNINNGTSARDVQLFGLPFELGEATRRKSGIGMAIGIGGEFAPRISDNARFKIGGIVQRREYEGKAFDDMIIALYAGPRLVVDKWDLSATGTAFERRFGGDRLNHGFGAKFDATYYNDARTALSLTVSAQQIRYPKYPLQTGPAYSASAGVIRALTPASSLNARIGVSRKAARTPELASWSESISIGYYRDLRGGFSVYAEPRLSLSRYDAVDPFFGKRRKDRLLELQFAVLNRRIVLSRFTPRIALTFARRNSIIDLFDFSQRRLEFGVTSSF